VVVGPLDLFAYSSGDSIFSGVALGYLGVEGLLLERGEPSDVDWNQHVGGLERKAPGFDGIAG